MIDEPRYCEECGCEILSDEDVGFDSVEETRRMWIVGCPKAGYQVYVRPFVVCRACAEQTEREWEAFIEGPAGQMECAFERWARRECSEAKSATI